MGLNIKNPEAEAEIRGLAADMGVGLTEAVLAAVKEARAKRSAEKEADKAAWMARVMAILDRIDAIPDEDPRPWREIEEEMYDDAGLPI